MNRWRSEQIKVGDLFEGMELFFEKGWTDGLPIVPPTPHKVEEMLSSLSLTGQEVIGSIPERNLQITAEKAAINAVMAGCLPAHFPVVIAGLEAVLDPRFGVHGPTASTGGASLLLIVSGPIVSQLGFNTGHNLLGPGHRTNLVIGRAVQLALINAGGTKEFDQTTLGHPGKIGFCLAEREQEEWETLNVEQGFRKEESTVTVIATEGPNQIYQPAAKTPEVLLRTIADRMVSAGTFNIQRNTPCVVVIGDEHWQLLVQEKWSKQEVKDYLFEHAKRPKTDLLDFGFSSDYLAGIDGEWVRAVPSPEALYLIAGGGKGGPFSAFIPGWGSLNQSQPVTKLITHSGFV
ncbi:hypothetical protein J2S00_000985 [Caldalkalibacillus uzonensis]|uniref:Thioredoxin n=1 Tax=Caldalkalibacillus uzonensis TaxID=353224 RepID=A0ABU0CP63_9BACI|nr:hypothetical protein [Caldalkalibacillus uzonensis]MDQ0338201.1 hypothetical protein [Caldalkalibacillus uzonensis]